MRTLTMLVWLVPLAVMIGGRPDAAHARHFKAYGYQTLHQGEVEVVYWLDWIIQSDTTSAPLGKLLDQDDVSRHGLLLHSVELEYGVTDRWMIAQYLDFEQPAGEGLKYVQVRSVVTRYRFFEQGERWLDGAIYLEYYLPQREYSDKEKLEVRVILQKDVGRWRMIFNPKFEKVVAGEDVREGLEFAYNARLARRTGGLVRLGLELHGSLGELTAMTPFEKQRHYLFPTVDLQLANAMGLHLGLGFALTAAEDQLVAKLLLEYEME